MGNVQYNTVQYKHSRVVGYNANTSYISILLEDDTILYHQSLDSLERTTRIFCNYFNLKWIDGPADNPILSGLGTEIIYLPHAGVQIRNNLLQIEGKEPLVTAYDHPKIHKHPLKFKQTNV